MKMKRRIVLKVGASSVPHAEILQVVKPILAEEGIDLQITEFTDYIIPNTEVESRTLDANCFQHGPYLENFNEKMVLTLFPLYPFTMSLLPAGKPQPY